MLEKVVCPNCQSPINLRSVQAEGAHIQCPACGGAFILRGHVCPHCGTYHAEQVSFCRQCGQTLARRCPQCETVNWIGDEYCVNCGAPLDILEVIVQRMNRGTQGRLDRQIEESHHLKVSEKAASEARMARLMEAERQRQLEIRRRLAEQREREKKLLTLVLAVSAAILILIIVVSIISALS